MEFREKVKQNDEKLRLIFKINEDVEVETVAQTPSAEVEPVEDEEEEVITLNPNTLYETSDESEVEISTANVAADQQQHPVVPLASSTINSTPPIPPQKVGNGKEKKDIFHCRFCDVVFPEHRDCENHEFNNHDAANPFECVICSFKCADVSKTFAVSIR